MSLPPGRALVISQNRNLVEGDLIAGSQYKSSTYNQVLPAASPLAKLYEKLRADNAGQVHIAEIAEQLQHYCTAVTDGDVRGLTDKLTAANRADLLRFAAELKQAATKTLMKWQTSGIAQDILTQILAKLYVEFVMQVTPAVQAGASRADVDALISDKVINATFAILGDNDLNLTAADLTGFLFFLGGNCHIRWDAC